jgi:hypothetical protein
MIAAGNERTIRGVGQSVAFGDKNFEVVKEFVYLESLVTPNKDVSLEIQSRIPTAIFHVHQNSSFTRPWSCWTKREKNQLLVFERKVLQTICGPK